MAAEGQLGAGGAGHLEGSRVEPLFKAVYGRGLGSVLGESVPFNKSSWNSDARLEECLVLIPAVYT